MTELNVFEDQNSGYIVLENEGRIVKATPQQAIGLMVSLARRYGYQLSPLNPQQNQNVVPKNQEGEQETPIQAQVEEESLEETEEQEDDDEVEELFEDNNPSPPQPAKKVVPKTPTPPPPPPPKNVAAQIQQKMMQQRSPGKVGKNF